MQQQQSQSVLFVKPISAQLNLDPNINKADPFIVFNTGANKVQSSVCYGGNKNPHWNDSLEIHVNSNDRVLIEVWGYPTQGPDGIIAVGELPVSKVAIMGGNYQDNLPLYYKGQPAGTISVSCMFKSQNTIQQQPQQYGLNTQVTMNTNNGQMQGFQTQQQTFGNNQMQTQQQFGTQMQGQNQPQFGTNQVQVTFQQQQPQTTVTIQPQMTYQQPQMVIQQPQTVIQTQPTFVQQPITFKPATTFVQPVSYVTPPTTIIQTTGYVQPTYVPQPTIISPTIIQPTYVKPNTGGIISNIVSDIVFGNHHHHHHGHHHGHHKHHHGHHGHGHHKHF